MMILHASANDSSLIKSLRSEFGSPLKRPNSREQGTLPLYLEVKYTKDGAAAAATTTTATTTSEDPRHPPPP